MDIPENNQFEMVVLPEYKKEVVTVVEKAYVTYTSRHNAQVTKYRLIGVRKNGGKAVQMVSKEQWDMYDVPVKQDKCRSKQEIKNNKKEYWDAISCKKPKPESEKPKSSRKVFNEEIEKWLLENNGIDFSSLVSKNILE